MPIDRSKGLDIVKKLLFVLPFLFLTFLHYSYARIIKNTDDFSQEISIQSVTDDTFVNPTLTFKEIILKKVLKKKSQIEFFKAENKERLDLNEKEKKLAFEILNQTIGAVESTTKFQHIFANSITEKQTFKTIYSYLSKARISLEAKKYLETVYLLNKAIEIYNSITFVSFYTLSFKIVTTKDWWFFGNQNMEIKTNVDGNIYYLNVVDTNSSMAAHGNLITRATFGVPGDIINLIEQASQIVCKIYFSQSNRERNPSVFNIPANAIYEWKQIINAE